MTYPRPFQFVDVQYDDGEALILIETVRDSHYLSLEEAREAMYLLEALLDIAELEPDENPYAG